MSLVSRARSALARVLGRPSAKPRKPGRLKGRLWVADDFDETPDEVLDSFEGTN
jgi:hypothetical protein